MKTVKSMLAGAILLFVCVAGANAKPATTKLTRDDVVNTYIDAIAHGDMKGLDNVLDDSLHFDVQRNGVTVNTLHKDQLMDYLQSNPIDPSVTTSSEVVNQGNDATIVKVTFRYAGLVRTDYLTLENVGGWAITKVESSFS